MVSLSELDLRIIGLVSDQRVVTSTQLELLLSDVPGRTLRYRTEHLHRAGLLGRSRPYRERGSAPYHLWPSRRADTLARGAPHRGGERAEPNPLFLAHAVGVTELYALLATQTPGVRLARFEREPREPFTAEGRSRTLAPDALVELHDGQGLGLLAFVELDLGTMSHARLKVKAGAYAAYAAQAAWTERYDFSPCLLFITTTEARAVAFLKMLAALLERAGGRGGFYDNRAVNVSWFAAGACEMAREPYRAFSEPCWDDLTLSGGGLCLLDCLRAARAPYDTSRAEQDAAQRASEAERERLRSDPDAWRALLQEHRLYARSEHFEQFGTTAVRAVELLLASTRPMELVERSAFTAVARQLDPDPLQGRHALEAVPASAKDREAVARLVDAYRACQRERVAQLAQRYGSSGPKLRRHQEQLSSGGLIDVFASERLEQDAARDQQARIEQERLRIGYLQRREQEVKHRKYDVPFSVRLTHGRAAVCALIDRERLHICCDCNEVVYPSEPADESHGYLVQPARREPARCHFCGAYNLDGWDERHMSGLLYGGAYRPLRSADGSDLLDREQSFGDEQEEQWS